MLLLIHRQEDSTHGPFGGPLREDLFSARQSDEKTGNNGGGDNGKSDEKDPEKPKIKEWEDHPGKGNDGGDSDDDDEGNNGGGAGNPTGPTEGGSEGTDPRSDSGEKPSQGGGGGQQDTGSNTGGGGTNNANSPPSLPLNSAARDPPPSTSPPESPPASSAAPPGTERLAANVGFPIPSDRPLPPISTKSVSPSPPPLSPTPTNVVNQHSQSPTNAPMIASIVIAILVFLVGISFFLYRYLRARRTRSTMRWWWSRRRATAPFHDASPTASRGSSPTSWLDSDDGASRSHSTLPSMSFANPSLAGDLSNPPMAILPATMAGRSKAPQFPYAVVSRRSDTSSVSSSQTARSSRRTTGDHSKLHNHPFFSSDLSLPRPPAPPLPHHSGRTHPMSPQTHATALSSSSFASMAPSYNDPFNNPVPPSTACATSPEVVSSGLPSSDWHTHSTDSVLSLPFSSSGSDESNTHDSRIIIVSSTQDDDSDSVDYHTVLR